MKSMMKKLRLHLFICLYLVHLALYSQAGLVDTTFGTNGFSFILLPEITTISNSLAIEHLLVPANSLGFFAKAKVDAQRRPVVTLANVGYFFTVRLLEDGSLDGTFGNGGKVITSFPRKQEPLPPAFALNPAIANLPYGFASGQSIVIDQQGKIVVAGYITYTSISSHVLVVRYNYDGSIDTSFGNQGILEVPIKSNVEGNYVFDVICDTQNRLIVVGTRFFATVPFGTFSNEGYSFIMRILPNGTLDKSFGTSGVITFKDNGNQNSLNSTAVNSDLILYAVGSSVRDLGYYFNPLDANYYAVANGSATALRFLENGSLDLPFGNLGNGLLKTMVTPPIGYTIPLTGAQKVIFDNFQRFVMLASGTDSGPPGGPASIHKGFVTPQQKREYPIILRYINIDQPDNSFGRFGVVSLKGLLGEFISCREILVDLLNNYLIAGSVLPTHGNIPRIYRIKENGTLDVTYGANHNGIVDVAIPATFLATPPSMELDASGRLTLFVLLGSKVFNTFALYAGRFTSDYDTLFQS